jgi:transcriptional regulator with GAF, ATPase, and Fis domain
LEFGQHTDKGFAYPAGSLALDHPDWSLGFTVGRSTVMQRLFAQMRSTAPHLRIATVEGESGAGKTTAACTLHTLGPAASGIFLPCPATQFFEQLPAVIRESRDGTLLLTHIEELSGNQQMWLLDFLQWLDHQHARHTPESAPRQVFFSSNHPVRKLVSAFSMRIDLANRLTVIRFSMPPLRERREDVPLLAEYFAQRFSANHNKPVRGLGPQALPRLLTHLWPGNVRELESVIHVPRWSVKASGFAPSTFLRLPPHSRQRTWLPRAAARTAPRRCATTLTTTPTWTTPFIATSIWFWLASTETNCAPPACSASAAPPSIACSIPAATARTPDPRLT